MKIHPALNRKTAPIRFTAEGLQKLKSEIGLLYQKRKTAVDELRKAREMGDLSENGYYKEAKARLSFIDSRLRRFNYQLRNAVIVAPLTNVVDIGSTVVVWDGQKEMSYELVGDMESAPGEGKISLNSPIGKALTGKKINDEVQISIPAGLLKYKILRIK